MNENNFPFESQSNPQASDATETQPSSASEFEMTEPYAEASESAGAPAYEQPPVFEQQATYSTPDFDPTYSTPVPPTPPQRPKKKHPGLRVALVALCCALIGSIAGGAIVGAVLHEKYDDELDRMEAVIQSAKLEQSHSSQNITPVISTGTATTPAQIYTANVPAIVGIANESTGYNVFGQPSATASSGTGFIISSDGEILTNYHVVKGAQTLTVTLYDGSTYPATVLGYEAESDVALLKIEATSSGTGFIISSDGEILTNYHVVKGAQTLTVTLYDGSTYPATVLGYEAESDVALLKIEATGLQAVSLGSSSALSVGDEVAAIGNPLGELTNSLTVGYVSAMDRAINTDGTPINMMQIDAAINPGNSGGPLFNMNGEVVGITTAKYSGTTTSGTSIEGIGFAIPINDVLSILDDLRENGAVLNRAYIGIRGGSVSSDAAEAYGLPLGVLVQSVEKNSSGERAGLKKSDIITAVGDVRVESYEDLARELKKYRAGDEVELTVYRSGQDVTLSIVFDSKPQADTQTDSEQPTEQATENNGFGWNFPWSFLP